MNLLKRLSEDKEMGLGCKQTIGRTPGVRTELDGVIGKAPVL
jgi:hypothetical protein